MLETILPILLATQACSFILQAGTADSATHITPCVFSLPFPSHPFALIRKANGII